MSLCKFGVKKEEKVEISCPEKKGWGRALRLERLQPHLSSLAAALGPLIATLPIENFNKD